MHPSNPRQSGKAAAQSAFFTGNYLVLEYVPGKTLSAWLKERRESGAKGERGRIPRHPLAPLSLLVLMSVACEDEPMPSVLDQVPDAGRLGVRIDRCLLKNVDDRLGSARELCEELEAILLAHRGMTRADGEDVNP